MILKDGLYLFPNEKGFAQYGYSQFTAREMGSTSSGCLLIDFLDFNIGEVISLHKQIESLSGIDISKALSEFDDDNAILFLIRLMTGSDWVEAYIRSTDDCDAKYKA